MSKEFEGIERRSGNGRREIDAKGTQNGRVNVVATWTWRIAIAALIALLSFNFKDIHSQVHETLPKKIEKVADSKVSKDRFNDMCNRLDRMESKIDKLLQRRPE